MDESARVEEAIEIDRVAAVYFRDQLRNARAIALQDSESFHEALFALEKLGSFLHPRGQSLGDYESDLGALASLSPLATDIPASLPDEHSEFRKLFSIVRRGRNEAMHVGAFARHFRSASHWKMHSTRLSRQPRTSWCATRSPPRCGSR